METRYIPDGLQNISMIGLCGTTRVKWVAIKHNLMSVTQHAFSSLGMMVLFSARVSFLL